MKINEFHARWRNTASTRGHYQRIDADHPLDFFIGEDSEKFKELLLITDYEPSKLQSGKSVEVVKRKRSNDGRWVMQIRLVRQEHEDVFIHLCWDLIESSREAITKLQGLGTVLTRFVKWQKLMEYGSGCLSDEVIKGIIGELTYARTLLGKLNLDTIVSSWLGPEGADRDFVFNDTWTEVKAISTGKLTIDITSIEQLDTSVEGILAVVIVDDTSPTDGQGSSFASVINDFKALLKASPDALYHFEDKLVSLGYYDRKEYDEKFYILGKIRFFVVDNNFPRLTRGTVRNEIARVRYEILLQAIADWEIEVT